MVHPLSSRVVWWSLAKGQYMTSDWLVNFYLFIQDLFSIIWLSTKVSHAVNSWSIRNWLIRDPIHTIHELALNTIYCVHEHAH